MELLNFVLSVIMNEETPLKATIFYANRFLYYYVKRLEMQGSERPNNTVAFGHMLSRCLVVTQVISAHTLQVEFPSQSQSISIPNKVLVRK